MSALKYTLSVFALFLCGQAASGACRGEIVSAKIASAMTYNPFSPYSSGYRLEITLRSAGEDSCSYRLSFSGTGLLAAAAGQLHYELLGSNIKGGTGRDVGQDLSLLVLDSGPLDAKSMSYLEAELRFPRGQHLGTQQYQGSLILHLSAAGSNAPMDEVRVPLLCAVPPLFQANIAGGGRVTKVDFGSLTDGDRRSVIIQTRATQDYRVTLVSANKGYLRLETPGLPEPELIDYRVELDGQNLDLSAPAITRFNLTQMEDSHRVTIILGKASYKRAGLYKDILTISIDSIL